MLRLTRSAPLFFEGSNTNFSKHIFQEASLHQVWCLNDRSKSLLAIDGFDVDYLLFVVDLITAAVKFA